MHVAYRLTHIYRVHVHRASDGKAALVPLLNCNKFDRTGRAFQAAVELYLSLGYYFFQYAPMYTSVGSLGRDCLGNFAREEIISHLRETKVMCIYIYIYILVKNFCSKENLD